jgi:hypothetical protein
MSNPNHQPCEDTTVGLPLVWVGAVRADRGARGDSVDNTATGPRATGPRDQAMRDGADCRGVVMMFAATRGQDVHLDVVWGIPGALLQNF